MIKKPKYQEEDRVVDYAGYEGMILGAPEHTDDGWRYTVRHICKTELGPWDCFDTEYLEKHLWPAPLWLRAYRFFYPGYLTTHPYGYKQK